MGTSHPKFPTSRRKNWGPEDLHPFGTSKEYLVQNKTVLSKGHVTFEGQELLIGFEPTANQNKSFYKHKCTCSLSITTVNKENEVENCIRYLWKVFMKTLLSFTILLQKVQLDKEEAVITSLSLLRENLGWVMISPSVLFQQEHSHADVWKHII